MALLSYRDFMEDVRRRLNSMGAEDLRNLILKWASEEYPSKRHEFLVKLTLWMQHKQVEYDTEMLIKDIEAFAHRVWNGEYCDGWGWDDAICDERDFGDESWAEEMDEFLVHARSLVLQGENKAAEEAYTTLFDILEMGQEPGHLPGTPDSTSMLNGDMHERVALFLRSVYMNSASKERPNILYQALNEYAYLAHKIGLKDVMDASDTQLPDIDIFLADWIEFLTEQNSMDVSELLREAVTLKGGISAISEFARECADKYPRAYLDWLELLEKGDDVDSVIEVAREGLLNVPLDYAVRAEIAEVIARIGEKLNDNALKLEGYRECFYSNPSIGYLLDLYLTAIECGRFEEIRDAAEQRIMELRAKSRTSVNYRIGRELDRSFVSEAVLINSMLLGGRYERVFDMCKGKGSLGWSLSENPKPVFVTFMMVVLSKKGIYSEILYEQWERAISNTCYNANNEYIEKYQRLIGIINESIQLTREQEEFYLKWCKKEIERRVDAIVSNKYRGSYHKAAGLLVAMAETLANRGEKQEGMDFIETYRNKYSRYSAFRKEVKQALQTSKLF